jgi:hypothetical protein
MKTWIRSVGFLLFFPHLVMGGTDQGFEFQVNVLVDFVKKETTAELKATVLYEKVCQDWKAKILEDTKADLNISKLLCGKMNLDPSTNGSDSGFIVTFQGYVKGEYRHSKNRYRTISESIEGTPEYNPSPYSPAPYVWGLELGYNYVYELNQKCHDRKKALKDALKDRVILAGCSAPSLQKTEFGHDRSWGGYLRTSTVEMIWGTIERHLRRQFNVILSSGSDDLEIRESVSALEGEGVPGNISSPYGPDSNAAILKNVAVPVIKANAQFVQKCSEAETDFKKYLKDYFLAVSCRKDDVAFKYELHTFSPYRFLVDDPISASISGKAIAYYLAKRPSVPPPPDHL